MSRVYKQQPGPTDNKAETPAKETKRTRTTKPVEKDEPKEDRQRRRIAVVAPFRRPLCLQRTH